ncbi:hypothetical protein IID20_05135 [Patescibacteria group bacterium]|nr:hypothetical protein [Patescibacteria group bacterium]
MKFAIFLKGISAEISAGPNTPEQEILKIAAEKVHSFPAKPTGKAPIYIGANRWIVELNDVPLDVVEANSKKEAIAIKEEETGQLGKDMRAEEMISV